MLCERVCMLLFVCVHGIVCPRGPMDKASAYEAGDCGFESRRRLSFLLLFSASLLSLLPLFSIFSLSSLSPRTHRNVQPSQRSTISASLLLLRFCDAIAVRLQLFVRTTQHTHTQHTHTYIQKRRASRGERRTEWSRVRTLVRAVCDVREGGREGWRMRNGVGRREGASDAFGGRRGVGVGLCVCLLWCVFGVCLAYVWRVFGVCLVRVAACCVSVFACCCLCVCME